MKTTRVQLRVPERWLPKMQDAARKAGFKDKDKRGTTTGVADWLRALVAAEIGETNTMGYHDLKEQLASCVHYELSNFRETFKQCADPGDSQLHRATFELGCLVQDIPKGEIWGEPSEGSTPIYMQPISA